MLFGYVWPGNVRQLENAVRRIALTAQAEVVILAPKSNSC